MRTSPLLLLLVACAVGGERGGKGDDGTDTATGVSTPTGTTPVVTTPAGSTPSGTTPAGTTPTGTTSTDPTEPVVDEEDAGSPGDPSEALFDDTVIHEVAITLSDDAIAALMNDGYTYVPGGVTVDGVGLELVGVRLRGKIGSYRDLDEKPKFKIDFNQYLAGQRLFGVETLTLNNSVADCSFLIEKLSYEVYRELGLPASRVAFATVTVNGAPYGLYQLVETQDDRYLDHHFDDPTGNLYDGKYVFDGGFDSETLDFEPELWPLFQLEEGVDVGNEDVRLVTEAIAEARGTPDFYARTGERVDWDRVHRFLAGEQWVDNWDGYALNQNNYRVYFDPASGGRAVLLPFDLDLAMADSFWDFFFDWASPSGELAEACFDDRTCSEAHRVVVSDALDTLAAMDIEGLLTEWDVLTADAARDDPRKECSNSAVESSRRDLRRHASGRDAELRDFWGL